MDNTHPRFHDLFEQLGLPASAEQIQHFIHQHNPLAAELSLPEAPFWTPAQAGFLRQQWQQDADWSELVDQLDNALRAPKP
ncbi:DUF2789 domain-containing protein [Curvibacter sp. RS43]|uniref:DUF2789 domain-containing protein n=1 Tax=Curvibacter microcysteis TaxID=3026419 RepID=A0ABT5MD70_9BURK|nr:MULTISPECIES: DUF2789 domain-containing protein [unclassified Curvibacter]MDD0809442.1 DUF2789 domain-containing protein [Curvibacter sp. RS43]MDD0814538.1 DUF2789 domain-containing protein [Curvibacter sp. HBC28]